MSTSRASPWPSSATCWRHLKKCHSRRRKLAAERIAAVVLVVLCYDQRLANMAGSNDISATTVRRWVLEVIGEPTEPGSGLDDGSVEQ
ncbi:hypothetical protein [Streptomyces umbrinus]|uniref:hypothetical protein n=1 Tax=Streptomyces umbrinus TaxID=67370 RepID=UPI0033EE028A